MRMTGRAEDSFLSEDASRICNNFSANRFGLVVARELVKKKAALPNHPQFRSRPLVVIARPVSTTTP